MTTNSILRHGEYYRTLGGYALAGIIPSVAATCTASAALHIFKQLAIKGAHLLGAKALQEKALVPLSLLPEVMPKTASILFITACALSMLSARYLIGNPTTFYENRVLESLKNQKPLEDVLAAQKFCEEKELSFKTNVDNLLLLLGYREPRSAEARPEKLPLSEELDRIKNMSDEERNADTAAKHTARIELIKKLMPDENMRNRTAHITLVQILDNKSDQALELQSHIPALIELMGNSLNDEVKTRMLFSLVTMSTHNPKKEDNITKLITFIKAAKVDLNVYMTDQYEGITPLTFIGYYLLSAKQQGSLTDEKKELATTLMHTLLSNGAHLSKKDDFNHSTLLDLAFDLAEKGESFLLKKLLSHPQIDLGFRLKSGETALTHIILKAPELRTFIPQILKKTDKRLLDLEDAFGYTPLIAALEYGKESHDYRLMESLLKAEVNPNTQNQSGQTALHVLLYGSPEDSSYSFAVNHKSCPEFIASCPPIPLKLLLRHGAETEIQDTQGHTAESILSRTLQNFKEEIETWKQEWTDKMDPLL